MFIGDRAPAFIPAPNPVRLVPDALDVPEGLLAMAEADRPGWGMQMFGGAHVFADGERAAIFARAVEQIRRRWEAA